MPEQQGLKLLFVNNPRSGRQNKSGSKWVKNDINWEHEIRIFLKNTPYHYEIYNAITNDDRQSVRYWIDRIKPDKIGVIGGDGTVKMVVEASMGLNIPICIFPAGSSNGMAKEIEMPATPKECMEVFLNGEARYTDAIYINEKHLCIHLSDIGINAQLVKYFEENDMRGKMGYAKEIMRVLWKKRLMDVEIKSNNKKLKRSAFMVVIANASKYGTGARINPIGDVHDGLFEVVILRKLSLTELLKMLFFNRKFNPKKTELLQASQLDIKVKKKVYFQVDGEYLGKTQAIHAVAKPKSFLLVFPKKSAV